MAQLRMLPCGLALLLITAPAHAQDSASTWGFTNARVDSYTAAFVYTGYGYRSVFAMGAVMYNPRSKYTELLGGLGARRRVGGNRGGTHFVAAAISRATDSRYLQLYYLPSARLAGIDLEATLQAYVPLEEAGSVQYYVTPLSAVRSITPLIGLGASYELAYQRGFAASHFLGPTVRVSLPGAQASLDAHAGVANGPGKLRFSYRSFY